MESTTSSRRPPFTIREYFKVKDLARKIDGVAEVYAVFFAAIYVSCSLAPFWQSRLPPFSPKLHT